MTPARPDRELPRAVLDIVEQVLDAAGLDFVEGRDEVEDDLRAHFEDGLAAGQSPEELIARFGDPLVVGRRIARTRPRASARNRGERRWWMSPVEILDEVRKAVRRLARAKGFALVVVLTLALGIGANTAIFTVLNAVLLEDLPYPEPERIVRVFEATDEGIRGGGFIRGPFIDVYRGWDDIFEEVASLYTYREMGADLTDGDRPERVYVMWVSAGYFEALGIAPERGRTFHEDESFGPGEPVARTVPIVNKAVISHGLWTRRFGGSEAALGGTIALDGTSYEIVGIMPRDFRNPFGTDSDVWLPHDLRPGGYNSFGNSYLSAVARLREGVSVTQAQERARTLAEGFAQQQPEAEGSFPRLVPLHADVVGETRATMLWILAAAAGLVLLTACLNVANLLFARGLSRDRDLALRSALGSGRGRLVAGILAENGLLALAGGLVGLALGWLGVRTLLAIAPGVLPGVAEIRVGIAVFGFATVVTCGALLLFGLTPALRMSRTAPSDVLRSGDRASSAGRTVRRVRDALVVGQVGVALALVAGAALFTRSFGALVDVPLAIDPEGVLTFEVHLPETRYVDGAARQAFHERLHAGLSDLSNVDAVGATSWLPVQGRYHSWGINWHPESPPGENDEAWHSSDMRIIAGDYFGSMGIDVVRGASPVDVDLESEMFAWVNQRLAQDVFGEVDPIGQTIWAAGGVRRVVGVVEDVPHDARGEVFRKTYVPHAQYADDRNWALTQTVRARGDLGHAEASIRDVLAGIDNQLVLFQPRSFEDILAAEREQDRFATALMGAFAALALILSLVGTYGVLAGTVASRTREIGIRMALGASATTVRSMVLRYAAALMVPGVLLGLAAAWVGSRWIAALLFEVQATDPWAYAAAVFVFVAVGLFAGWLPAERATRVDTVEALTAE